MEPVIWFVLSRYPNGFFMLMALRDQPYFPFYVDDYLTDERLNRCSAASQGVFAKIMCVLHKQENYGRIKLKEKDKMTPSNAQVLFKQNLSMNQNFAMLFAKLLPFDTQTIFDALEELVEEGVLTILGDEISQKRMVKDFTISEARSAAAKKGGGNPNLFKQKRSKQFKQNPKQNPVYEYEYLNVNSKEEKEDSKEEKKAPEKITVLLPFGEKFSEAWAKWKDYKKKSHRFWYKSVETEKIAIDDLVKISGGTEEGCCETIRHSIAKGYKGLFPPKTENKRIDWTNPDDKFLA